MALPVHRLPVTRHPDGPGFDEVVEEEPLAIRVEGRSVAITLRTPGHDLDLTAGFLWTEGVIDGLDDVVALAEVAENTVDVRLAEGVPAAQARAADRELYTSSSCGVCGKASLDRLARSLPALPAAWEPDPDVLLGLPASLRALQHSFARTGGLHAAALFDPAGRLFDVREDVGRHNAVDKVLGARLRADAIDLGGLGLVVSSRAGFEIVQKAWAGGVPVVACVGPPTRLAVETAARAGMRLYGWLREGRFTRYTP